VKAIILVGGEGTRLRPLTLHRLKGTVPMAGRPFLEYQFEFLRRYGVRDVTLSICHMPELVKKTFGNGRRYGLNLHYAVEQKPLGTAGAIKNAERYIAGKEPVVIMNGDILTDLNLEHMQQLHRKNRAVLTIGLTWVEDPSAYGLVHTNTSGRVQRFVEKPDSDEGDNHWINAGVYLFDPSIFSYIPENVNYSAERGLGVYQPSLLDGHWHPGQVSSRQPGYS
jgi:NDP-sugar pyrophosphorylase family protein